MTDSGPRADGLWESKLHTESCLTIANIREKSPVLRDLESSGGIKIAGSMYYLETGVVEFLG
jgi:hypothetical protein